MTSKVKRAKLDVASTLADFIETRALPGTGIDADRFWDGFSALLHELAPRNKELLDKRKALQDKIDGWHIAHRGQPHDGEAYQDFLREIGYLLPEG